MTLTLLFQSQLISIQFEINSDKETNDYHPYVDRCTKTKYVKITEFVKYLILTTKNNDPRIRFGIIVKQMKNISKFLVILVIFSTCSNLI